jgi:energy-converting hydrogenase Eha subunit A
VLALNAKKGLFHESAGGVLIVVIRRVIVSAQAELPQRRGLHRMIRYSHQNWRGQFKTPVIALLVLTQHQTQKRPGISVRIFALRLEKIPVFVALVNGSRDSDRSDMQRIGAV